MSELKQRLVDNKIVDSDNSDSDEEKRLDHYGTKCRSCAYRNHGEYCYCDECKVKNTDRVSTELGFLTTSFGLAVFSIAFFILFTVNKAEIRANDDRTNALYFFSFLWVGNLPFFTYFFIAQYKRSECFQRVLSLTSGKVCLAMIPFFALFCLFLVIMFEQYGLLPVNRYDCYPQGTCSQCIPSAT